MRKNVAVSCLVWVLTNVLLCMRAFVWARECGVGEGVWV